MLDIVGLEVEHLSSGLVPNIARLSESGEHAQMEPVFPAVTCTVQASILSGKYPDEHGIISNGLYDRGTHTVSFWEQPSSLVQSGRIWDAVRNGSGAGTDCKTAVLFWQNTMFASSDIVVTPRPLHMGDGSMVPWCYSRPAGYYEEIKSIAGEFDLSTYWGPFASHKSSEWIAKAAEITLEKSRPEMMFVYIPHVDYSAQRFGKKSAEVREDLRRADAIVGSLVEKAAKLGMGEETEFIILSEYAFDDVRGDIPINLALRDEGLLATRVIGDKEYMDFEYSKAFAMVDHQVAHVYVKDGHVGETRKILEGLRGIDRVLSSSEKRQMRIDHERSGELIAISDRDRWFSYYWWHKLEDAPPFADTVDIHRKPGYDPLELFFDREKKSISQDTGLIKGSHGRPADNETGEGFAFYASSRKLGLNRSHEGTVKCVDIAGYLLDAGHTGGPKNLQA